MPNQVRLATDVTDEQGAPIYEVLNVKPLGGDLYQLMHSPKALWGLAAGDVIRISVDSTDFTLVRRGGNLCVQMFCPAGAQPIAQFVDAEYGTMGWLVDNLSEKIAVVSVPAHLGLRAVEGMMSRVIARFSDVEWQFGNVYDPQSEELLEWLDEGGMPRGELSTPDDM